MWPKRSHLGALFRYFDVEIYFLVLFDCIWGSSSLKIVSKVSYTSFCEIKGHFGFSGQIKGSKNRFLKKNYDELYFQNGSIGKDHNGLFQISTCSAFGHTNLGLA